MKIEPEYAQNIIVGVIYKNEWIWYVTDRDVWFLDQTKLLPSNNDYSERFDIPIVNENTAEQFLEKISGYQVSVCELTYLLIKEKDKEEPEPDNFGVSLMVDFDKKQLFSFYPEPMSFEYYVPDGWTGEYLNFESKIPHDQRYWIIDGENYFRTFN
ncbi:hypothetical protein IC620_15140 [Hazenella sp. IB182357]|uniref:Group-specific protein n=1 Tax=Polycladospora coralii TaxID=2771432 RepID=A0A926RU90_9BACL|nr:hypothetical protein [Polycladospora coralii]MBD1373680.1 hypothetical protein [Polycladospora coralii]